MVVFAGVCEDSGMHARMEGFHATFQAFGESGERFHGRDVDAQTRDGCCGGTSGDDLHPSGV